MRPENNAFRTIGDRLGEDDDDGESDRGAIDFRIGVGVVAGGTRRGVVVEGPPTFGVCFKLFLIADKWSGATARFLLDREISSADAAVKRLSGVDESMSE